jgi:peptide chain release factor 1
MFQKLNQLERKYLEIESRLMDPELGSRPNELRRLSQEHAELKEIVDEYNLNKKMKSEYESNKELILEKDEEIKELAKEEIKRLEPMITESDKKLQILLLPKDPNDLKNVIIEIRAGAGGDEASLFVGELFRMYQRYASQQNWKVDILSSSPTGLGGYKEIIAMIEGEKVYSRLKWEGGVHRVQRVPETEAQGRVHTSTVTVAILAEAEEVDIDINPADLRIDVFRSGGAGGQSVNTTDSAVRITHIPTGVVVSCQDERSQHKNKDKALKILRSRILESEKEKAHAQEASTRKSMVGTGDRSERIRTYNFPQERLTDHRIGLTVYNLSEVMEGNLVAILDALQTHYQVEALKFQGITGS